ncbi:hypothetical protein LSAT2_032510 [Lamellibrachia satsuma]|nr:hypothetical protein LSAT2_032510 [Lamellibrachia satsuma]
MASRHEWQTLKLYITSYHADFGKERELLLKEVIPALQLWCEAHCIELQETDVRWGGYLLADTIANIHKGIEQSYLNNVQPFFINITSDSLGLLPTWTDGMDSVIEVYQRKLKLSSSEVEMLQEAYNENNPNSLVLVREDHVLDDLFPGETREFMNRGIIPMTVCRDYLAQRLQRYPCKRVVKYSYEFDGWDAERNKLVVKLAKTEFADKILEFVKTRIGTDFSSEYHLSCDKYVEMRKDHTNFMEQQSAKVKGRESVLAQIENYIRGSSRDVPLLVKGGAGCGKTAIMAAAAEYLQHKIGAGQLTGYGSWQLL